MPEFIQSSPDSPAPSGGHAAMTAAEIIIAVVVIVGGFLWWRSSHQTVSQIQLNRGAAAPLASPSESPSPENPFANGYENPFK